MSGWRLGFAVASAEIADAIGKMINTTLSCTPPIVQLAGTAALKHDRTERDDVDAEVPREGRAADRGPEPDRRLPARSTRRRRSTSSRTSRAICNRLGITSHGLALYLLEGADDSFGVACLGGECFGDAGAGFLRFSCAEPNDRLKQALRIHSDGYLEPRPSRVLARQESAVPPRAPVSDRLIGLVDTRRVAIDDLTAGSNPQPPVRAHDRPATRSAALGCPRGTRTRTSGSAGRDSAAAPPSTIACRP